MAGSLKDVSFLIVDDQDHMCHIVREMLYAFGARNITTATTVQKALDKYSNARPDLIIADYRMRPVDGIEFAKFLRNHPDSPNPFVPIIMMTADATKQTVSLAMDAGVNELLVKPLRPVDLWKRIEGVVMHPRAFVRTAEYFGPDRREVSSVQYSGPEQRTEEVELL